MDGEGAFVDGAEVKWEEKEATPQGDFASMPSPALVDGVSVGGFTEWSLDASSQPTDLAQGSLWFAEEGLDRIGRFWFEPASRLVITDYPSSVTAGTWTTKYTVQRQDQYGNPVTSGLTTVNLASSSDGASKKFSETAGGSPVPSVTIPDGSSTADFYYYDEKAGIWTISVSATGLAGDSKSLTVNPSSLASFTMTGYPSTTTAGQNFGTNSVTATAYDAYGNVKTD